MYRISDQQVDFIANDIRRLGIKIESLQQNLLDHICIIIEQNLEKDGDFEQFYNITIKTFYKEELREIEEETIFLMTRRGPHVLLSRIQFFLLLFTIFIGPYIGYDICWAATSNQVHGFFIPDEILATTFVFALFPLLVLLVLFTTPERLDPLIPRRSKVMIGIKPFIKIIPPDFKMS